MIRIGIPRALCYYQYYPMLKTFFEELGAEVVISPPTTQAVLSEGSSRVVAETCLPAKVFLGHVLSLVKDCDYVFIPAIRSVKRRTYNCSKLLGLPDMTKAVIPESPPILDIDIDLNKGKGTLYRAIYKSLSLVPCFNLLDFFSFEISSVVRDLLDILASIYWIYNERFVLIELFSQLLFVGCCFFSKWSCAF